MNPCVTFFIIVSLHYLFKFLKNKKKNFNFSKNLKESSLKESLLPNTIYMGGNFINNSVFANKGET